MSAFGRKATLYGTRFKKEGADVRYGSLADIEVSMDYVALRPKADILQHGFHVR
jgi:hypothetical protein